MVTKRQTSAPKTPAASPGLFDSQLAQAIKDSAQQIWLAGLGAFAKAQGEGNKVFETLIKEGTSLHRKTQAAAGERLGDMAGRMTAMAEEVGSRANAHWDKLEAIFEQRTARALGRLGVPTAKEVAALAARVDALAAAVARLSGEAPAANRPARRPRSKAPERGSGGKAGAAPAKTSRRGSSRT
jgi:poly(hydroxyalkanoate) granule-associated protein